MVEVEVPKRYKKKRTTPFLPPNPLVKKTPQTISSPSPPRRPPTHLLPPNNPLLHTPPKPTPSLHQITSQQMLANRYLPIPPHQAPETLPSIPLIPILIPSHNSLLLHPTIPTTTIKCLTSSAHPPTKRRKHKGSATAIPRPQTHFVAPARTAARHRLGAETLRSRSLRGANVINRPRFSSLPPLRWWW